MQSVLLDLEIEATISRHITVCSEVHLCMLKGIDIAISRSRYK